MKNAILLTLLLATLSLSAQSITGTWYGILEVPGNSLRVVFHIAATDDGYITTMDSPDQGVSDIPTDATTLADQVLTITMSAMQARYAGTWDPKQAQIEGTFQQGPASLPLTLTRAEIEREVVVRPQTPTDFPYRQEVVTFTNPKGGHQLAGTLTTPSDGNFNQVLVLITGSGPQDRNVTLFDHQSFLVLSDYLTRQGMGVLRYDDRGVAESGGDFAKATSADLAEDVSAAVDYLLTREDMADKQIGLVGHSEGGLLAPMVASQRSDIDFLVLLAGPGIPMQELMLIQVERMTVGGPPAAVEANLGMLREAYAFLNANSDQTTEAITPELRTILDRGYDNLPPLAQMQLGSKEQFYQQTGPVLLSPWFRYFITIDPATYLRQVDIPVLAINGELDLQVTAKENLNAIANSLAAAGNEAVTIKSFPRLNHLFQTAKYGTLAEYSNIEETFNEEAMQFIVDWLRKL